MTLPTEVRFVCYDNSIDIHPKGIVLPPEDFYTYLGEHEETDCVPCSGEKKCRKKDGPAWAPGWISPGKQRRGAHVESFDVVAFDVDHLNEADFNAFCGRFDTVDCLIYSTHSHREPDNYSVRVVCLLSRRLLARDYLAFWHAVVRRYELPADPKAKDMSRLFFTPRSPRGASRINVRNEGALLDVDSFLLDQMKFSMQRREQAMVEAQAAPPPEPGEVDLKDLRKFLQRYRPDDDSNGEKREMVRRVLTGEPLADKPGHDTVKFDGPPIYGRDDAVFRVAHIVGWRMPLDTPFEAAWEILRPSVAAMPQYEGDNEDLDFWKAKAKVNYEKAAQAKLSEAASTNKLVAVAQSRATTKNPIGTPRSPPEPSKSQQPGSDPSEGFQSPPGPSEDLSGPDDWMLRLTTTTIKGGGVVVDQLVANAILVLENHPAWKGVLRFDEVTKSVECIGGPLPEQDRAPSQLLTAIESWLQASDLRFKLHASVVQAAVFHVARRNSFDPVRDYLFGVRWDGVVRLPTWLETYCRARIADDSGMDITRYVRDVGTKWFVAAAARGLSPGCKVDNVLVLEGEQGIGKSRLLNVLGGEWFTDSHLNLTDKDTKLLAAQSWIMELAELSAMRKTESESQKAFFSQREDRFRPPYGRVIEAFLRRCVFVGTTNDDEYLLDVTGNRRIWPIYCEVIDIDAVARDRDQLWAEAVVRFQNGERHWFEKHESDELEDITDQRLRAGGLIDAILEWWATMESKNRPTVFSLLDVATEALGLPKHQIETQRKSIGQALKRSGFIVKKTSVSGVKCWRYHATKEQLGLPSVKSRLGRRLAVIAGGKSPSVADKPEALSTSSQEVLPVVSDPMSDPPGMSPA